MSHFQCWRAAMAAMLLSATAAAGAATLQLAATGSPAGDTITRDVLSHAYGKLGIEVHYVDVPLRRAFAGVQSGEFDGITSSGVDRLDQLIRIGVPVTYNDIAVFTIHRQFRVDGYASLKPYSIGVVAGIKYFEEPLRGMRVDNAPNIASLFKKLEAGRTDIVLDARASHCVFQRMGYTDIRMLEPVLERRPGYHFLSERRKDLVPALEAVLSSMQKDGSMKRIQDKAEQQFLLKCE